MTKEGQAKGMQTEVVVPIADGWRCTAELSWTAGVARFERVAVERAPGAGSHTGLSQEQLRKVPFRLMRQMATNTRDAIASPSRSPLPAVRQTSTDGNLYYYARVAELYVEEARTENSPVKTLAHQLQMNSETLRKHLQRARKYGLLVAATPGVPGGALTDKARVLIEAPEAVEGFDSAFIDAEDN